MTRYLPHALMIAAMLMLCGTALSADAGGAGGGDAPARDGGGDAPARSLPEGHPQVPGAQMPAGHPQTSPGQMPAGHPQVNSEANNTPFTGSIAIKATQGTKDAAEPAGDAVRVDFYMRNKIVSTQEGKLDDHGVTIIENVKLLGPVQPLVTVTHAGVPYRSLGGPMSADRPDQMVRVTVFETTTESPAWQVGMYHVMIERTDKGLMVNQVLVISTPGDRTWIGSGDSHDTLVIPLPANRTETYLGPGLQDESVKIEDQRVVDHLPLAPGDIQLQLAYIIPVNAGEASLEITAPAAVKQMVIFTPDDGSTITPTGAEAGKGMKMGPRSMRMFTAANMTTGRKVSLVFKGIPAAPEAPKATSDAGGTHEHESADESTAPVQPSPGRSAKVIAGVGAGVLGVAVAVVLIVKKPGRSGKAAA
ncbi:MAG: hypothetical protein ACYC26_01930 [Phycisphaerales bacterium]